MAGFSGRAMGWVAAACLALTSAAMAAAPVQAQDADPWTRGKQWLSVRAGYARSAATGAADGNLGFGFGYTRVRSARWAWTAAAQFEILGRYGDSNEIEVPWTLELTRNIKWSTAARPYLGLGAGVYYNKISGTPQDAASLIFGPHLAGGINFPVSSHSLIGFDIRMSVLKPDKQLNPVFGGEAVTGEGQSRVVHWGAKVSHSWVF